MIYVNYEDIDWDYLYERARIEKTIDELEKFKEIIDNKG